MPFIVLGEGSDVLFTDDFNGVVLINRLLGYEFSEDANYHFVKIQAGERFDNVIRTCIKRGIYGLENLAFIPGTAGAAPVQNIGAYGASFSDFCRYVEVLDLNNNKLARIKASPLATSRATARWIASHDPRLEGYGYGYPYDRKVLPALYFS